MKLVLSTDDGLIIESWKIDRDLDVPDLDELLDAFYTSDIHGDEVATVTTKGTN